VRVGALDESKVGASAEAPLRTEDAMATALKWVKEDPARWDANKARIVGDAPVGTFDRRFKELKVGDLVPGTWWRAESGDKVVGFGWLDVVWGEGEILLATASDQRNHGAGTFILEHLTAEARARGLNYVYNVVRASHPQREAVARWLEKRGFKSSEDGSLLRAVTKPA
jgi:ribosomal protein S18 acetylase RimI-like enzyme